jgi:hypothetical protein
VRAEFERLIALGRLPTDADLDDEIAKPYVEAIDALSERPTAEEAAALLDVLPADKSTSFGLAWSIVHAIESSPEWPVWSVLDDRNWWVTYLRQRCERAGLHPPA